MVEATRNSIKVDESKLTEAEIRVLNTLSRELQDTAGEPVKIGHFPLTKDSREVFTVTRRAGSTDLEEKLSDESFLYNGVEYELEVVENEEPSMTGSQVYILFRIVES